MQRPITCHPILARPIFAQLIAAWLAAACWSPTFAAGPGESTLEYRAFGKLTLYANPVQPANVVLFVSGKEEIDKSLCPQLSGATVTVLGTSGGHHFDGHYEPLIQRLINAADESRMQSNR
jgi:hypothetical protein